MPLQGEIVYYFTDMSRPYMRDTTESRLALTRCKYKNCAKIKRELSTMHMTFTSPERF